MNRKETQLKAPRVLSGRWIDCKAMPGCAPSVISNRTKSSQVYPGKQLLSCFLLGKLLSAGTLVAENTCRTLSLSSRLHTCTRAQSLTTPRHWELAVGTNGLPSTQAKGLLQLLFVPDKSTVLSNCRAPLCSFGLLTNLCV